MRGVEVQELQVEPHHAVGSPVFVPVPSHVGLIYLSGKVVEIVPTTDEAGYRLNVKGTGLEAKGRYWPMVSPAEVLADELDSPEAA